MLQLSLNRMQLAQLSFLHRLSSGKVGALLLPMCDPCLPCMEERGTKPPGAPAHAVLLGVSIVPGQLQD